MKISDFENSDLCMFTRYQLSRTSYDKFRIEPPQLIENEIGGVITCSLAAEQKAPLTKEQHLADRRSIISKTTQHGRQSRAFVYTNTNDTPNESWRPEGLI
jgi:hypothetical protein